MRKAPDKDEARSVFRKECFDLLERRHGTETPEWKQFANGSKIINRISWFGRPFVQVTDDTYDPDLVRTWQRREYLRENVSIHRGKAFANFYRFAIANDLLLPKGLVYGAEYDYHRRRMDVMCRIESPELFLLMKQKEHAAKKRKGVPGLVDESRYHFYMDRTEKLLMRIAQIVAKSDFTNRIRFVSGKCTIFDGTSADNGTVMVERKFRITASEEQADGCFLRMVCDR